MPKLLSKEKRKHSRLALNRLIRVTPHNGQTLQMLGINYSQTGLAFNSKTPIPSGEFVDLEFRLNEKNKEFNLTAEVMQNYKEGSMYVMGVRFLAKLESNSLSI